MTVCISYDFEPSLLLKILATPLLYMSTNCAKWHTGDIECCYGNSAASIPILHALAETTGRPKSVHCLLKLADMGEVLLLRRSKSIPSLLERNLVLLRSLGTWTFQCRQAFSLLDMRFVLNYLQLKPPVTDGRKRTFLEGSFLHKLTLLPL